MEPIGESGGGKVSAVHHSHGGTDRRVRVLEKLGRTGKGLVGVDTQYPLEFDPRVAVCGWSQERQQEPEAKRTAHRVDGAVAVVERGCESANERSRGCHPGIIRTPPS